MRAAKVRAALRLPRLRALRDVREKRPHTGKNLDALDGIRGLAVLMVVASHCHGLGLARHGAVGVWLFFTLSAFLLCGPMLARPEGLLAPARLRRYGARRIRRIVPAYYTVLGISFFWVSGDLGTLFRHLAFLEGNGIWWTIPQEMLFYVVLPFLAASHRWLFRGSPPATALGLAAAAVLANHFLTPAILSLRGNGSDQPFYLGTFLCGMSAAAAYQWPALRRAVARPAVNRLLHLLGFALLGLLFASAETYNTRLLPEGPLFDPLRGRLGWRYPGSFGAISAALIFVTLVCEGRLLHRLLASFPLRALGIVSFSLYLLHIVVREKLRALGMELGTPLFLAALAVSYALACGFYGRVERPFLQYGGGDRGASPGAAGGR